MRVERISKILLALGLLLLLIWIVRVGWITRSLQGHLSQAQAITETKNVNPKDACELVQNLHSDLIELNQEVGVFVPLAPVLSWLPNVGGDLQSAPQLLATANGLSDAGSIVCNSLAPMLDSFGNSSANFSIGQMVTLLASHHADLERAANAANRAQAAWAQVDVQQLSPSTANKTKLLDKGMPLIRAGLTFLAAAPDLLGANGARTYLILAMNEDELRPSGGFISGAGRLKIDQGKFVELSFLDGNLVDDLEHQYYPDPPKPLFDYMTSEMWLFRDSNWSPDFPTTARQAADFYELGQGVRVDGVIALDQGAIELLLSGLGEIQVPGFKEPVTAANVRQLMREAWNPSDGNITADWVFSRKEFMGRLASAVRNRIEQAPGQINLTQTGLALYSALVERHVLVYSKDQTVVAALAQTGWDGALQSTQGDYMMIVDANVGFSKVNPLIKETVDYQVALHEDGTAEANLSIKYTHTGKQSNVRCEQAFPYLPNLTYDSMMQRCYYDYLRVLIPAMSVLGQATAHPTPAQYLLRNRMDDGKAQVTTEAGKTVLAQFFVVEYGKTLTTQFQYDLPVVAPRAQNHRTYSILFQKQPGTYSTPVSLTVALPEGAHLMSATPAPSANTNGKLVFTFQLDTDVMIRVTYE